VTRRGTRLGIDVGTKRVGVARSDPEGLLATPLETLDRTDAIPAIASWVDEFQAIEVVVGHPISLSGRPTASTQDAVEFARQLATALSVPVVLLDERLSTVSAGRILQHSGKSSKKQRPVIDQAAAVIILQHSLDSEASSGIAPGSPVDSGENNR